MLWLLLGIASGFFFSVYHIINKIFIKDRDPIYFAYSLMIMIGLISFPFLIILRKHIILNLKAILFFSVIALIIVVAQSLYFASLKLGEVSKTAPLLTLTPLFTLVIAMISLHELPSYIAITGIILLVIGTYLLNYTKNSHFDVLEPFKLLVKNKSSRYMMIVTIIYGLGSVIDKHLILSSNALTRILLYSYFSIPIFSIYLIFKDGANNMIEKTRMNISKYYKPLIFILVVNYLVIIPQMWGISLTNTVFVISLKRTAAIFTVIFAYFIFHEKKDFMTTLIGAVLMVAGVFLIVTPS